MPRARSTSRFLMLVTFLAFVSIGFPDAVLGVAWPVFEISGRVSPSLDLPFVTQFYFLESIVRFRFDITLDLLDHMLMPALALALPLAAAGGSAFAQSAPTGDEILAATPSQDVTGKPLAIKGVAIDDDRDSFDEGHEGMEDDD